jgi:hypothetical protein
LAVDEEKVQTCAAQKQFLEACDIPHPCSQIIGEAISRGLRYPSSLLTDYQRSNFQRLAISLIPPHRLSEKQFPEACDIPHPPHRLSEKQFSKACNIPHPCSQIIREAISRGLQYPSSLLTDYQRSNFQRLATSLIPAHRLSEKQVPEVCDIPHPCSQIISEEISRGLRHPSTLLTD